MLTRDQVARHLQKINMECLERRDRNLREMEKNHSLGQLENGFEINGFKITIPDISVQPQFVSSSVCKPLEQ